MLKAKIEPYQLKFIKPAKTSRGEYIDKKIWILKLYNESIYGLGEIAPLPDLSIEYNDYFETTLESFVTEYNNTGVINKELLNSTHALNFAWQCAIKNIENFPYYFKNNFTMGKYKIPINGLVWMDDKESMKIQIDEKINQGYKCIKIKIGAIDFEEECSLLHYIRKKYSANIEIRVDANGAFENKEASYFIKSLEKYSLHSIEQPIKPQNIEFLSELCATSKVKIALDEELIGLDFRTEILKKINPHYLVIKPTLLGGFENSNKYIKWCEENGKGWWVTSALESNIGLMAISQWVAGFSLKEYQGLGTGTLYQNNFMSNLKISKGEVECTL